MSFGTWLKLRDVRSANPSTDKMNSPTSLLIVRLDHIGDLVLSSPFFREIRGLYPQARITVVCSERAKNVLDCCPYVDEVLGKPTQLNSVKSVSQELAITRRFCKRYLAGRRFDVATVLRWDTDLFFASFICLYSNASKRIAFTEACSFEKHILNLGFDTFFTDVLPPGPPRHEVERNLDVVRHLGGDVTQTELEFWCAPSDYTWVEERLHEYGISLEDRLFAFGIGATKPRRRWPISRYAELIDRLALTDAFTPVVICGPEDASLVADLRRLSKSSLFILPNPTLRQTGALLSRCTLFVGNNSGPLHIATAMGLPVIEISCHPINGDPRHENDPARFGPFGVKTRVIRPVRFKAPCKSGCEVPSPHCITGVTVEDVCNAVLETSGVPLRSSI
jgi:heptosyltransferase-2